MSSDYAAARAAWLELEQLATQIPSPDQTCRKCGAGTEHALCASCTATRLNGLRRFGGRAGSNKTRRHFTPSTTRRERLPYPDDDRDTTRRL